MLQPDPILRVIFTFTLLTGFKADPIDLVSYLSPHFFLSETYLNTILFSLPIWHSQLNACKIIKLLHLYEHHPILTDVTTIPWVVKSWVVGSSLIFPFPLVPLQWSPCSHLGQSLIGTFLAVYTASTLIQTATTSILINHLDSVAASPHIAPVLLHVFSQ